MTNSRLININLTFKNTEATDALKQYATDKISGCLKKFVHQDTDANLVLNVEKNRQIAEITFHSDGANFKAKEKTDDLYKSIDALVNTITAQLRKHKDKLTSHH